MNLSTVIARFGTAVGPLCFDARRAMAAMGACQTEHSPRWRAACAACDAHLDGTHACGHRACPHCQHRLGQLWQQRQRARLLPVDYFLVTFTLPAGLRALARCQSRTMFDALMRCAWDTLRDFARNDRHLAGGIGATAVLHTHNRRRDFHPHVHLLVPAGAVDRRSGLWRSTSHYLFRAGALATVFRARLLGRLRDVGLRIPDGLPDTWIADCRRVGQGEQALGYLARYLYRGVLSERDLLGVDDEGQVRFRYRDGQTGRTEVRRLPGAEFLRLLLQHVLPKGFHRVRDYGLLHPKCATQLRRVQLLLQVRLPPIERDPAKRGLRCPHCGAPMRMVATRLPALNASDQRRPERGQPGITVM
jgi:DNA-directed RNA polymerase subunit RPC12/RpoP